MMRFQIVAQKIPGDQWQPIIHGERIEDVADTFDAIKESGRYFALELRDPDTSAVWSHWERVPRD